jgi:hypothetical protein
MKRLISHQSGNEDHFKLKASKQLAATGGKKQNKNSIF